MDLESIRREYLQGGLRRNSLPADPFTQFELWLNQAIAARIPDPTAFSLATVAADGQPEQRLVLLKHVDAQGLVFFTNYRSGKARDIAVNPKVSLHFPWHGMERQVRIIGRAEKVPAEESARYFASRPRDSQLAAWASPQSEVIASRRQLLDEFAAMEARFTGDIPLPDFWGGYRITPAQFEFWQGGASRLHDRFCYRRDADGAWSLERLAP